MPSNYPSYESVTVETQAAHPEMGTVDVEIVVQVPVFSDEVEDLKYADQCKVVYGSHEGAVISARCITDYDDVNWKAVDMVGQYLI